MSSGHLPIVESDVAPIPANTLLCYLRWSHHESTLLTAVGEVVVPGTQVVVDAGLCDLPGPKVKVGAGVIQL